MRRRITFCFLITILLIFFTFSCQKKRIIEEEVVEEVLLDPEVGGSGGLPGSATPGALVEGGAGDLQLALGTESVPISKAEFAKVYSQVPDQMLTVEDYIKRDWANGLLSDVDWLKQKLCYFYGKPCLLEKYQQVLSTQSQEGCGTSFLPTITQEIASLESGAEEVTKFWNSLVGETSNTQTAVSKSVQKGIWDFLNPGDQSTEIIETENHQHRFIIFEEEPNKGEFRFLTDKELFEVEGRKFEIFYSDSTKEVAQMVKKALGPRYITPIPGHRAYPNIIAAFKEISDAEPKALDWDNEEMNPNGAYRIFVIPKSPGRDVIAYVTGPFGGSEISYMVVSASELAPN